ncbi:hypothetical protein T552_01363 [Pneumocystis carinii B80]|uniref:Coatomer subunit epsilon n=1 Tax=Pneumocystis carinii (strain B80) TaxID=1408658 RepID=A0A0W4ZM16_PNEC8|nr:hypothetical protein T552_01363 [Pneumocystis carinii B80]KTW29411.1 hypothetical protein T552_01363 [Pneumocystis carinii B80]
MDVEIDFYQARNLFYQGCFNLIVEKDLEENEEARILKKRAQRMLGKGNEILWVLKNETTPESLALRGWIMYEEGDKEQGISEIRSCISMSPRNSTVQILGGHVLYREEQYEEALELLKGHSENVEAVALIVQILLKENRLKAAQKEIEIARKWAPDDVIIQLSEAWIDLYKGGQAALNSFYIYEELAQTIPNPLTLTGQAVAELQLGRLEEAEETLAQVLTLAPYDGDALANSIVTATLLGKDTSTYIELLTLHHPSHEWVTSMTRQSTLFDELCESISDT